ncbi:GIY-YIG nuclease family protein [Amycolatopsis thermoflava]|uniref:hypothetical protein n=1 Tax=Amycolatopsis thermoflava TaxID=84480 RepID=UPI00365581C6
MDFIQQQVRLLRGKVGGSYLARGRRPASETAAAVLVNESDLAELDVRVHMTWQHAGPVSLDEAGDLAFPELPRLPGIYRLTLRGPATDARPQVYVGESVELRRRAAQYRRPSASQQTSQRLNHELKTHFAAGGTATMAIATSAIIAVGDESEDLPLGRKTARVLAEHAALALTYLDGEAVVINRDSGLDASE